MLITILDITALMAAKALTAALRALPESRGQVMARWLVSLVLRTVPRWRKVGRRNLQIAFPDSTAKERERILRASEVVLARNLLAFAHIPDYEVERCREMFDAEQLADFQGELRRAHLESGGGGHSGSDSTLR